MLEMAERYRDWPGEAGEGEGCCAMRGVGQDSGQWETEESWLIVKIDEV